MTPDTRRCAIWGTPAGGHLPVSERDITVVHNSLRAAGTYGVTFEASQSLEYLEDAAKARLTTWIVNEGLQGNQAILITLDVIEKIEREIPLSIQDRANRLLRFVARHSPSVGEQVALALPDDDSVDHRRYQRNDDVPDSVRKLWGAMAWSESREIREIAFLLDYLTQRGWLIRDERKQPESVSVTVDGYSRIEDSQAHTDRNQAFVAMWFADDMNDAFGRGIQPALEDAGYSAMRIDRKEHVNKIDDEIIAEIRRSRFLVADFSQGEDGARGGVYFEAGFALGLGIPVIYTCRKSDIDKLHFDTRQYNHIVWETPEELRPALKNRILAVIGEGPNAPSSAT